MPNITVFSNNSYLNDVRLRPNLVDDFLNSLSERTKEDYRADLKDFTAFMQMHSPEEAAKTFVSSGAGNANEIAFKYKKNLKDRELAPNTVNRRLTALKSLIKYCNLVGIINWRLSVIGEKVRKYKDTRGVSVDVLGEMISRSAEQTNERKSKRDVAILRLMGDMGLRREEVTRLDFPNDVDLEHNELLILGKGQTEKERRSMGVDTAKALKEWLEVRGEFSGPLFISLSNRVGENSRISLRGMTFAVSEAGRAVGIKTSPHKLRHTAITQAAREIQDASMQPRDLLDFSRHKDIRTAFIYVDQIENRQGVIAEMVSKKISSAVKRTNE